MSMAAAASRLRLQVLKAVRSILGVPDAYALVDFPNYANVGDSAIYLGELACLSALGLPRPAFVCDVRTFDRSALACRVGDGPILLAGGGNFGDVWPGLQRLREEIVRSFPNNRIIQLPQSIHFQTETALRRAREVIGAHRRFTLMVRDRRSLEIARRDLGIDAVVCPDMALCLGPLARPSPTRELVWLSRTDVESAWPGTPIDDAERPIDWVNERRTPLHEINRVLSAAVRSGALESFARGSLGMTYVPLARSRLRRGVRSLSAGRVVITDRLHGHILCLLLGIRHVLLDNSYGKISSFHDTWSRDVNGVYWAASPSEAIAIAREVLVDARNESRERGASAS